MLLVKLTDVLYPYVLVNARWQNVVLLHIKNEERISMNRSLFDDKWKQIRGLTTGWWSLMSEYDLSKVDKAEVKFDKYVNLLQVKYGYTYDQAKKEVGKRVEEYETQSR
ncbi:MAG: hypothetical protein CO094_07170 [Anaerolineae bacterium CG_4_9_14_3_um_filter_57_17]|nr:MAG: hypothetical protein AUK01_08575 [Anaerolineae bacterium CG2_30_57_67]PJB66428.1 MAG: hypothetical protein CO094_07170 [Anaerolineae bacterium CG_4_9_14_3_um_filter_57_17]